MRNIFACLVHENHECVVDLVRNLHFLDPSSVILLYNGGPAQQLLNGGFSFEQYGGIVHPSPKPMAWGRLHDFALDCMKFALEHLPFDTLTIVDSDQLGARPGYSNYLARFLHGRKSVGLLGNSPEVMPRNTHVGPILAAYQEIELWRPFIRRFPQGEGKFPRWSFWPSTVFTRDAARDLTKLFATDPELQRIMQCTTIWATEEVILPTLTALLGYETVANPCSYDYVQYRVPYTLVQIDAALNREDVFWLHPIPRLYDDPLRERVREKLNRYEEPTASVTSVPPPGPSVSSLPSQVPSLLLSVPILKSMKAIEGWLEEDEADLLIAALSRALAVLPEGAAVVEVGSFCGRATIVLGNVVKALRSTGRVYAIDPHDGKVGSLDGGLLSFRPTLETFRRNIAKNALSEFVETVAQRSVEVAWDRPIGFFLVDGLHDYASVSADFQHFESWVVPGGSVAFHDYGDYFPGVKIFVNEILATGRYQRVQCAGTMIVLTKNADAAQQTETGTVVFGQGIADGKDVPDNGVQHALAPSVSATVAPLVSCLMPTANRPHLAVQAIQYFLRQDYPNRELIILDDGRESIANLVPADDRIRYIRLRERQTIGAKHNMGCELARGDIILHWDDDDWMANWRISYQVTELMRQPAQTLTGLSRVLFYNPPADRAWEYIYPAGGRPWVAGATFCYFKSFWQERRFPDMNEGGDTVFVWELKDANVAVLQDHTFYVATVHAQNTSPKHTESPGWHPLPSQAIRRLLDDKDREFYDKFGLLQGAQA